MIRFDRDTCRDLRLASTCEWLETNGLGGFASSTITGLNTRRYHGLLVAALNPPVGRHVLLAKLEETISIEGRRYELSTNQYPGTIHPTGYRYLTGFRLDPFPVITYEVEGIEIEKRIFMRHGENCSVVQYHVAKHAPASDRAPALDDVRLEVRPLEAFRDFHSLTHENPALVPSLTISPGLFTVQPYRTLPPLHVGHDAEEVDQTAYWYRSFEYRAERERGLDFTEDLFSPCALAFDLGRRPHATFIASVGGVDVRRADEYRREEIERRARMVGAAAAGDDFGRTLVAAADQFIVSRGEGNTVIAGYHWFTAVFICMLRRTIVDLPQLNGIGCRKPGRAPELRAPVRTLRSRGDYALVCSLGRPWQAPARVLSTSRIMGWEITAMRTCAPSSRSRPAALHGVPHPMPSSRR